LLPAAAALLAAASLVLAQSSSPRFEDYPAAPAFTGKPAPPKLGAAHHRLFRSMIRAGAAQGPNFAGHYTIALWGCGSSCGSMAVVDAKTGRVFDGPFGILGSMGLLRYPDDPSGQAPPLTYRLDSRLLIVRGCPEDDRCGAYYYEWKPPAFHLLRKLQPVP
jgi:hypothetical protein